MTVCLPCYPLSSGGTSSHVTTLKKKVAMAADGHFNVTQEAILDFLQESGGRVKNTDLIERFKAAFPEEPEEKAVARNRFKNYVDSIAFVRAESGVKYVCLRKKFREGLSGKDGAGASDGTKTEPSGEQPVCRHHPSAPEREACGRDGAEDAARGEARDRGTPGSGSGNDSQLRVPHAFTPVATFPGKADDGRECCEGVQVVDDGTVSEMGNRQSFRGESRGSKKAPKAPDIPEIAVIEPSPLPAEDPMFTLPGPAQTGTTGQVYTLTGALNRDRHAETKSLSPESPGEPVQVVTRRHSSKGPHVRIQGPDEDEDDFHLDTHSLSGSEGASSPKGSRRHFIEVMMNSSPQVRRSMVLRNSVCLSSRSDSDSVSLVSSNLDEDRALITLDPLEHEWMMCASDGEWASLNRLLTTEPSLVLRKDFITGFTCLHWAAKHGKPELLALIINFAKQHDVPISVDVRTNTGYTPLHIAAMHNHMEVVKLLVGAYNADVEIRDYSGRKACQYLTDNVSLDIRDIIGAYEHSEDKDCRDGGRRRFSKVLQSNLKPLRLLSPSDCGDGVVQLREKPVRRKSSFSRMKPKLERLRLRTSQIVHSTTFHDMEELDGSHKGSFKSRPKTHFFG